MTPDSPPPVRGRSKPINNLSSLIMLCFFSSVMALFHMGSGHFWVGGRARKQGSCYQQFPYIEFYQCVYNMLVKMIPTNPFDSKERSVLLSPCALLLEPPCDVCHAVAIRLEYTSKLVTPKINSQYYLYYVVWRHPRGTDNPKQVQNQHMPTTSPRMRSLPYLTVEGLGNTPRL